MASPLLDKILAEIKTMMKSGDKDNLSALRMLHAQVKDATTNAGKETTDADVAIIIAKAIKQRQDAIAQFQQANRHDLADKDQKEIDLYKRFQPQQLTESEIGELVKQAIAETGAANRKDMGKVMQALMPHVKGRADGKLVNQIVQAQLPG